MRHQAKIRSLVRDDFNILYEHTDIEAKEFDPSGLIDYKAALVQKMALH